MTPLPNAMASKVNFSTNTEKKNEDQNRGPASTHVQTRVRRSDKAMWTKAANRAVKLGLIKADKRGVLAPWLLYTLNQAAAKTLQSRNGASSATMTKRRT